MSVQETPIPRNVYWNAEAGNFYSSRSRRGMGVSFYAAWQARCDEFPKDEDEANEQSGEKR